ncbi:MAG: hypothetical protein L0J44_12530, partial [Tetragenococcus koreensis]|nr:hypothetical protein [Tetragenococcus koreensis]
LSECVDSTEKKVTYTYGYWKGDKIDSNKELVLKGLDVYKKFLDENPNNTTFNYENENIVSYMWIGKNIKNSGYSDIIGTFKYEVNHNSIPNMGYMEYIEEDNPDKTFGLVFDVGGPSKIDNLKRAVKLWSEGKPYDTNTGSKKYESKTLCFVNNVCNYISSNVVFKYFNKSPKQDKNKQKAINVLDNLNKNFNKFPNNQSFEFQNDNVVGRMWIGQRINKTDDIFSVLKKEITNSGVPDHFYYEYINGDPMPEGHEGQCITDGACFNLACSVFGSSNRRISNFIIKDGMKDEAAKSFSDYSGLSIKGSDFVTNKNKKEVKQSGGQTITYNNCDFVDFSKEFPNPLDKIDNEYLDNMQSILDKVKSDYKKSPIEAYYSLTPLAALDDVSETMKTVKEQAKKFRDQERKQRILSIIGFVFMGISILAMPFGIAVNLAVDTALLIATTVAELKLTGKVSGDSLAFGLIAIIQPFVKFPGDSLSTIFKNIDLDQVTKLNGKFKANNKFEDIIKNKIKNKYC